MVSWNASNSPVCIMYLEDEIWLHCEAAIKDMCKWVCFLVDLTRKYVNSLRDFQLENCHSTRAKGESSIFSWSHQLANHHGLGGIAAFQPELRGKILEQIVHVWMHSHRDSHTFLRETKQERKPLFRYHKPKLWACFGLTSIRRAI